MQRINLRPPPNRSVQISKILGILCPLLLLVSSPGVAQIERGGGFEVALGLVPSSDYADILTDEADVLGHETSGYKGWVWLEAGFAIRLNSRLHVTPRIGMLAGRVSTRIPGFEASPNGKANVVLLPGVSATIYATPGANSLFGKLFVSSVFPFFDQSVGLDTEADGLSLGVGAGYRFEAYEVEAGLIVVPVRDIVVLSSYRTRAPRDSNVGGLSFALRRYF